MTFLLYLAGLIIGFTIFLYFYSTYQTGLEKIKSYREKGRGPVRPMLESQEIEIADIQRRGPGKRTCPLCGTPLQNFEALYAAHIESKYGKKILIYGCRFCYKLEEESDDIHRMEYREKN